MVRILGPVGAAVVAILAACPPLLAAGKATAKGGHGPRWRPATSRNYQEAIKQWQEPTAGATAPRDPTGRPMLVLVSIFGRERVELSALTDHGGFDVRDLDRASRLLHDPRSGLDYPVEPGLLDLVYQAQRHFQAAEVRVISGYRVPKGKGRSNHGRGRAMDVIIPGVRNEELTGWAQTLGFTGVGFYPTSGFCHLDVRPKSYFWVDRSGPRQRRREVPVQAKLAAHADQDAKQHQHPAIAPFAWPTPAVSVIWRHNGLTTPSEAEETDSLEDDEGGS